MTPIADTVIVQLERSQFWALWAIGMGIVLQLMCLNHGRRGGK